MANKMLRDLDRLQTVLEDTAEELEELSGKLYDELGEWLGEELCDAAVLTDRVGRIIAQIRSTLLVEGLE